MEEPDYEAAAQRMAEAIDAFLKLPQLHHPSYVRLKGAPETFDLKVALRRYKDEAEGARRERRYELYP